jgi:ankyrin repeat protein
VTFSSDVYQSFAELRVPSSSEDKTSKENIEIQSEKKMAENSKISILKLLLGQNGTDTGILDNNHRTPLALAAAMGKLDFVKVLVESGKPELSKSDAYSLSPLHAAAQQGHVDVVDYLVESGAANITSQDIYGRTALHEACARSQTEMVEFLVGKSTDILNMVDVTGRNALHYTLQFANDVNYPLIFNILTDHNITNNEDYEGFNVLHFAAWTGKSTAVSYYIKNNSSLIHSKTRGLLLYFRNTCYVKIGT